MNFAADGDNSYLALSRHYDACLRRHGDTAQGADWPNEADRQTRFAVMLDILAGEGSDRVDLLDFACGTGELYRLTQHHREPSITYRGVDLSELAVQYARAKFPDAQFSCLDILTATEQELADLSSDYCIIDGLFTVKGSLSHQQMWNFMVAVLGRLWPVTRKGIAFNVMSKQVDRERDDLFHVSFDQIAEFLYRLAGRSVAFRSDYGLFEFTCHVRKQPRTTIASRRKGAAAVAQTGSDAGAVCRPSLPTTDEIVPYLEGLDRRRWYSNFGEAVWNFEAGLVARFGLENGCCVTASSGTDALVAALIASAGRGRPERPYCLMPSYTFIGTAAAALNAGYEPFFVDIDPQTLALEPGRVAEHPILPRCGAIVTVAPYGRPVAARDWEELSRSSGVPVIIDAAAGFDAVATDPERTLGTLPVMVSLHATKVFGVGEGGIILCRDAEYIRRCRRVLNFGFLGSREALLPGFNGKMSEYHAAVGLAALASWPRIRAGFVAVGEAYQRAAQRLGIAEKIVAETAWASCYALYRAQSGAAAAAAERSLSQAGIDHRLWYGTGCHRHSAYMGYAHDPLPDTDEIAPRVIGLPVSVDLPEAAINDIVAALAVI